MPVPRLVRLISWSTESADRERLVEASGFSVDGTAFPAGRAVGHIRDLAPAAVLIDLDRSPAHGRYIGIVLRAGKSTSHVPLVFAGGEVEKIQRVRQDLPDAIFTTWKSVGTALKRAIKRAPSQPFKPVSYIQQWAGSTLVQKLGFRPAAKIALLGTPDGFEERLGELPKDVEFQSSLTRQTNLAIWFVRSLQELDSEIEFVFGRLPSGKSIWIAFPKKTSRYRVDFNSNDVRASGLAAGMVDYKICAIDADWTAMKFARKKSG